MPSMLTNPLVRARRPPHGPLRSDHDVCSTFVHAELATIRSVFHKIQDGHFRFPWELGGCTELLTLLKPGEDDIEGKLFSLLANLNIFAGLLVSGLIGYVLEPVKQREGINELTGLPNETLVHVQALFAHINLVCSTVMMTFTTYMCCFVTCETPRTILRCISNTRCLWVYMFITFLQTFLILGQACLAAMLNVQPCWAKIIITTDMVIFWALLNYSLNMLRDMFPLAHYPWLFCSPVPLLRYLLGDRDVYKRLGEALVSDAAKRLGVEGFDVNTEHAEQHEEEHEPASSQALEQRQEQRGQLQTFLHTAVPGLNSKRFDEIANAMLAEGLTVDRMVRTASMPQGYQMLFMALDISSGSLTRGERLDMINVAVERAGADKQPPAGIPHSPRFGFKTGWDYRNK